MFSVGFVGLLVGVQAGGNSTLFERNASGEYIISYASLCYTFLYFFDSSICLSIFVLTQLVLVDLMSEPQIILVSLRDKMSLINVILYLQA